MDSAAGRETRTWGFNLWSAVRPLTLLWKALTPTSQLPLGNAGRGHFDKKAGLARQAP